MKSTLFVSLLAATGAIPMLAGTVNVTFSGANGQTDSSGYLISPYTATINGVSTTIYCDDFANEVTNGENWTANVSNLASGNLSNTRYGADSTSLLTQNGTNQSFTALQTYEMAAWLSTQFAPSGSAGYANNGAIQDTIWDLFNPNTVNPNVNPPKPSSNTELFAAEQNYSKINPANFNILTNTGVQGSGQEQEFIFAPEPGSLVMLGIGIVAIAIGSLRKRLVPTKR